VPGKTPLFGKEPGQETSPLLFLQRKLSIGAVDDPLEEEADAMADKVMRMPDSNFIQRKCAHCEEEEKETIHRKPEINFIQRKCTHCEEEETVNRKPCSSFVQRKGSPGTVAVTDAFSDQLNSTKGNGNMMDQDTKSFMESRFGADFSGIKIHTGNQAVQMSRDIEAKAFTTRNDIYFNQGQYEPNTYEGKHLLAHELTHAIQQGFSPGLVQRRPARTDKDVEKCMKQKDHLLPSVGLVEEIHRETELESVLGANRRLLELQIKGDKEARKFVCEAGVPAIVALYDTRNSEVSLDVDCARSALKRHPGHYALPVMNQSREKTIPVGYTSFQSFSTMTNSTGKVKLEPGRQVRILSEDKAKNLLLVRVISGQQHCEEGVISRSSVFQATKTSLKDIKKLTLVFYQNPERIGETVEEIGSAEAKKNTHVRVPGSDTKKDKIVTVPKGSHMSLGWTSNHTEKEFYATVRFESGKEVSGYVPKDDVEPDFAFRTAHRRFFVRDIGVDLARKKNSTFVDIPGQLCSEEHLPIEYFTGGDIVNGILTAAHCTDKLVEEVHIIGHGGPHGMGATGNVSMMNGIYIKQYQTDKDVNHMSSLTAIDFAKATKGALADNVRFWLHACSTADPYDKGPGFAEQFADALIKEGGHSKAIVAGLEDKGPANKGIKRIHPFILFPSNQKEFFK
jgi:hypothetical protein